MPRALEPDQQFDVFLDCDKEIPEAQRPTFHCVSKSVREWKAIREAVKADKGADAWDAALALIRPLVVGWRNMNDPKTKEPIPFDLAQLDRVLSFQDAGELLAKLQFGALDKKKSV